jgi:adenylate kinase family enzyme
MKETAPLIDFYTERGLLIELDGSSSTEQVFEQVLAALGN